MNIIIIVLLTLTAASLGLRTVGVFLPPAVHPLLRLAVGLVVGAVLSLAFLRFCDSVHVFESGLGLLLSLSPAGMFDVTRWWFRWRRGVAQ